MKTPLAPMAVMRPARLMLVLVLALAPAGCACYRFGAATLYPPDIHTVYVPVFESDSFRRGLGERRPFGAIGVRSCAGMGQGRLPRNGKLDDRLGWVVGHRILSPTGRKVVLT